MEEEIDVRAYIAALLRGWWWIVGLAVLAAIIGLVLTSLMPTIYEARALALVTQPHYQIQFDPRFETTQNIPANRALPTLATSHAVLQAVVDGYTPAPEAHLERWSVTALAGMVEASSQGDPSLLELRVRARSPQVAADIANLWAEVLVEKAAAVYEGSAQDIAFLEDQLERARQDLGEAEAALIEFQSQNHASILQAQLSSKGQAQMSYLSTQITITNIIQDIQGLGDQLAKQPSGKPASLADSLTMFLLQIKAFNAQTSMPIQLQVSDAEALSGMSRQEQIAFLDNLVTMLQNRSAELDARLAALEPEILALQRKIQEVRTEFDRLTRQRNLAQETYLTLARKLDEAQIMAEKGNWAFKVASYAGVPSAPVGPRKLLNTAVAGMLGLLLGVVAVSGAEWWRK